MSRKIIKLPDGTLIRRGPDSLESFLAKVQFTPAVLPEDFSFTTESLSQIARHNLNQQGVGTSDVKSLLVVKSQSLEQAP